MLDSQRRIFGSVCTAHACTEIEADQVQRVTRPLGSPSLHPFSFLAFDTRGYTAAKSRNACTETTRRRESGQAQKDGAPRQAKGLGSGSARVTCVARQKTELYLWAFAARCARDRPVPTAAQRRKRRAHTQSAASQEGASTVFWFARIDASTLPDTVSQPFVSRMTVRRIGLCLTLSLALGRRTGSTVGDNGLDGLMVRSISPRPTVDANPTCYLCHCVELSL